MNPAFFLHKELHDFDEFCENVRNWDLDYHQLDRGFFTSELLIFGDDKTQFTHARIDRKMMQKGSSPEGFITFGILADPDIEIYWRNIDILGDMLFVFPDGGELNSISHTDFSVFVVSLSEDQINKTCALLELPDIRTLINSNEAFRCQSNRMAELRNWLSHTKMLLSAPDITTRTQRLLSYIEREMIDRVVRILAEHHSPIIDRRPRKRDLALLNAESLIEHGSSDAMTVARLCELTNVSERTLEYAFRERYGMTPKSYMITHRLNNARKQLSQSTPKKHRVSDIAHQHGFWHMGKFSSDYKRLFSESPSQTLRR